MGRLLREALAHRTRLVSAAVAVALSVTLVSGTLILTDTVDAAFRAASAGRATSSDLVVRSTAMFAAQATSLPERERVPESLVSTVAAVPGVEAAWTEVEGYAELIDKQGRAIAAGGLPTVGGSWDASDTLVEGNAPRPGEVAIDLATARRYGLELGDKIKVLFSGSAGEFTIGGVVAKARDLIAGTKALFDAATAQKVFGEEGQVDAISVKAAAGVSVETLRTRVNAVLPDRYEAVTSGQVARESAESWTKAVGFLPPALALFAAVALVVGAFIVANTFSILVGQRARELGLLRAVGASRAQLIASVLLEAAGVGLVASLAGIGLGLAAARGLPALLHGSGVDLPSWSAVFRFRTVVAATFAGVSVTVVAAAVPAVRATHAARRGATSGAAGITMAGTRRARLLAGGAAVGAGLASVVASELVTSWSPVVTIASGALAVLGGLVVLAPVVATPAAHVLGRPLAAIFGEPAVLARENATRSPRRTGSTAAALMIGVGLIGVVAILGASMKASAIRSVDASLHADFVLTAANGGGPAAGVPPAVVNRLRSTPGIGAVSPVFGGQWGLNGRTQTLLAVDPGIVSAMHAVDARSAAALAHLDDGGVLVRDTTAERYGWRLGDTVPMTFARTGTRRMRMVGTFSSTDVRTDYVISLGGYRANYAQQLALEVDVALAPGIPTRDGRARIEAAVSEYPVVRVMDHAQAVAAQKQKIDGLLVPITALLALSVLIALVGIANTLALSLHQRAREVGLLRAIGMDRRQLRQMIRSEALIIACLGTSLGLAVALFFGWVLVASLRASGVTELVLAPMQLVGLGTLTTAGGMAAGVLPARRNASLSVLEAIGR